MYSFIWRCLHCDTHVKVRLTETETETDRHTDTHTHPRPPRKVHHESKTCTERHNAYALAQTTLKITSQSVERTLVQACSFKALAGSTPKTLLWSVFQELSNETQKTRARELVIKGVARKGGLWRARTPITCEPGVDGRQAPFLPLVKIERAHVWRA